MILKSEFIAATAPFKGRYRFIVACVFFCHAILLPTNSLGQSSVAPLVLSTATLPPLTTPAGDGYLDRLYVDWFARAGLSAELVTVPAARALENANAGLFDGDAARIIIDASLYPDLHRVPESLYQVAFSGLSIDSNISVKTPLDFKKYRVGYVRGWRIAERLFAENNNASAIRDADGLLDMLAAKRLDIIFLTVAPARKLAREKNMPPLVSTNFKIKKDVYLHLHSRHLEKITRLTDTLRAMKSDGSYQLIMNDYVAENR